MGRAVRLNFWLAAFATVAIWGAALVAGEPVIPSGIVEAGFTDGSVLKLTLKESALRVATPYGKLSIPVGEIQRIDFATRLSDDITKRIEEAVADLANPLFPKREAASAGLLKLREKAYPALLEAAKSKDAEVARRASGLLERIRETSPPEDLEIRKFDVIETGHSKISGRIEVTEMRAVSGPLGEVQLKLLDMRSLRVPELGGRGESPCGPRPGQFDRLPRQNRQIILVQGDGNDDQHHLG